MQANWVRIPVLLPNIKGTLVHLAWIDSKMRNIWNGIYMRVRCWFDQLGTRFHSSDRLNFGSSERSTITCAVLACQSNEEDGCRREYCIVFVKGMWIVVCFAILTDMTMGMGLSIIRYLMYSNRRFLWHVSLSPTPFQQTLHITFPLPSPESLQTTTAARTRESPSESASLHGTRAKRCRTRSIVHFTQKTYPSQAAKNRSARNEQKHDTSRNHRIHWYIANTMKRIQQIQI